MLSNAPLRGCARRSRARFGIELLVALYVVCLCALADELAAVAASQQGPFLHYYICSSKCGVAAYGASAYIGILLHGYDGMFLVGVIFCRARLYGYRLSPVKELCKEGARKSCKAERSHLCYNCFMPLLSPLDNLKNNHEVVICDSELSRQAHKELFHFKDDVYIIADNESGVFDAVVNIATTCNSAEEACLSRIHLVLGWENILKISAWKAAKPAPGDAFLVLKNAGVSSQELQPFKTADINDMFPWLYYGKRFDVLRKVCHAAKRQLEGHLKSHSIRVDSHLIADDTKRIVASSL